MTKEEFRKVLTGAVQGNREDMGKIMEQYMPLIEKNSYVNGRLDEDLRQHLLLHIFLHIKKFPLN